ncbi:MAG: hypothetical protein AAB658_14315, partial [Chloroflexota bacterium]
MTSIAPVESSLVFAMPPAIGLVKQPANAVKDFVDGKVPQVVEPSPVSHPDSIPAGCEVGGLEAAPHGARLIVMLGCGDELGGPLQVVNSATGEAKLIGLDFEPGSIFLNWSPTGNEVLIRANILGDPRIYLVHVGSGKATPLNVPADAYDAAISADGKRIVYSLTRGLGFGSQLWLAEIDGNNAQLVIQDATHIIAYARFSPVDDKIAYIRMADSNIPFTVGELWVMNADGSNAMMLGQADAGHGYIPNWSPDGTQVAFVYRDNGDNIVADQLADRLTSNIYVADVNSGVVQAVTKFADTLVEASVWSPDG